MPSLSVPVDKKIIILPVVSCLLVAALVLLVISPLKSKIIQTREAYFDNQLKEKTLSFQIQKQDVFDQLNQTIKNDQLKINQTIPAESETLKIITALESLAESLGIANQNITLSEFKPSEIGFKTLNVTIDFTSNYATFVSYLYQLESSTTYINVESVNASLLENIRPEEGSAESLESITFHISAQTYWQSANE